MKKFLTALLCVMLLGLSACGGGNVKYVEIQPCESELYTEKEIRAAADTVIRYFRSNFSGCYLTELVYAGDEKVGDYADWAQRRGADEVIVLLSSFDVGPSGGDGSLNPNSTYRNWSWILVRSDGGTWQHADHGY